MNDRIASIHPSAGTALPGPPRSRRRWSWPVRLLLTLIALLLIAALVVQIILWTNVPRQIVLSRLQTEMGLRVTAESVSTGWFGHTTLNDVTLALPLADKPFLHVPGMRVRQQHALFPGGRPEAADLHH